MKIFRVFFFTALLFLAAACSVINPELTPFYTPPDPLPYGAPGEIIKTEKIETRNANVQAWRVMYHSRDVQGQDIAVTGIFAAPNSPPPADGFPLLALAHGTEGLGRQCAPSLDAWGVPSFASEALSFPDTAIVPFVTAGYAVTATDYQGLGAPGAASFLVGQVEAQNVLDSIRALRAFDKVGLSDQNFVWGHSQGGHSAAFTAQLANELAPELKLHGIVLAAPAAELQTLFDTILAPNEPSSITGVAAMVAAAWHQAYGLPLETLLTPEGIAQMPLVERECILGTIAAFAGKPPRTYYFADPTTTLPWADVMRLNIPQGVLYPAPVLMVQGAADPLILPQTTRTFFERLCQAGNAVQYRTYPEVEHLQLIKASNADVVAWLNERVKKNLAPSDCAAPIAALTPTPTPQTPIMTTPNTPLAKPSFESVILSDGAFTPDAATIARLEARLSNFLAQNQNQFNAHKPPIVERLAQYKFQYWGEIQNDKRVIVVNAFCAHFENWKTQRVLVLDGGDCFFGLGYDMETDSFFGLTVNGEA